MRAFYLIGLFLLGAVAEEQELIMLEVEPLPEKTITKRAAQSSPQYDPATGQYVQYTTRQQAAQEPEQQQIPAEYISLLQQLQASQGLAQQVSPNDIQQVLISGQGQYQVPQSAHARPILSPQVQQQNRIQLEISQKAITEQQRNDAQRQSLQAYLQSQNLALSAAAAAQYQIQQPQAQTPRPQPQYYTPQATPQYSPVTPQPQRQYYRIQPQEPERVSYAQVQYGGESASTPAPRPRKPQPLLYQPQPQQVVYQVSRTTTESPLKAPPQQYLIETTKPETSPASEQVVNIPRQQFVYYRPQPAYQDVATRPLYQSQVQYVQPEAATRAPSRSAIYVTKGSTDPRQQYYQVQGPSTSGRHLTQTELKALETAGFNVASVQSQSYDSAPEYVPSYSLQPQRAYYRGAASKRQSKRVPRPVDLTKDERDAYQQQGIRNLYRIETAESKDSPVTYVLALGKSKSR